MHVIQLSLKDLLGKIKANLTNAEAESEWLDKHHALGNIVATLKKRREAFRALQITEPKLLPIQDVRIR
ncbi:hypothetical protein N7505_007536 [Penicillium chrysogenum]|uniref:Uncharacterized protein n=1 Tax=Penicillium chrysogenum TaxID=5076 RepID=A0ABQ8WEE4_PENCH|nr:hypothetical protein N7505_007536 [Penicillium chrysogenum]